MGNARFLEFVLMLGGVMTLAIGVISVVRGFIADCFPKPPPKPRRYRVTFEDADGWPIRSYRLPVNAVGKLLRDLDEDKSA